MWVWTRCHRWVADVQQAQLVLNRGRETGRGLAQHKRPRFLLASAPLPSNPPNPPHCHHHGTGHLSTSSAAPHPPFPSLPFLHTL
jgi:hypothetical protein